VVTVAKQGDGEHGQVVAHDVGVGLAPVQVSDGVHHAHDTHVENEVDDQHDQELHPADRYEEEGDHGDADEGDALPRRRARGEAFPGHREQVRGSEQDLDRPALAG